MLGSSVGSQLVGSRSLWMAGADHRIKRGGCMAAFTSMQDNFFVPTQR